MSHLVTLTLAEAAQLLHPPLTERQLRAIITALGWQPAGGRHTKPRGRPAATYNADEIFALHAVLLPHMRIPDA